ncbi:MAG: hypothetical protein ACLUI2_01755 [Christensenellales bacterium]|jgi:hypothetical protein
MKTSKNQAVMPINVAAMIDENDPVFKMAEIPKKIRLQKTAFRLSQAVEKD